MLGKLINGVLITPSENEKKKLVITNPSDESLKFNMGYKDLIVDEKPEFDEEKQYLQPIYEETENAVLNHWEVINIPEEIPEEIPIEEGGE